MADDKKNVPEAAPPAEAPAPTVENAALPEQPAPEPELTDAEKVMLEHEGQAALFEMGEAVPDPADAVTRAEVEEPAAPEVPKAEKEQEQPPEDVYKRQPTACCKAFRSLSISTCCGCCPGSIFSTDRVFSFCSIIILLKDGALLPGMGSVPVSYTHLDVYKRQDTGWYGYNSWASPGRYHPQTSAAWGWTAGRSGAQQALRSACASAQTAACCDYRSFSKTESWVRCV